MSALVALVSRKSAMELERALFLEAHREGGHSVSKRMRLGPHFLCINCVVILSEEAILPRHPAAVLPKIAKLLPKKMHQTSWLGTPPPLTLALVLAT